MPVELHLLLGLAMATVLAYWATPVAIRIADRFGFYDTPAGGYKDHARPTPYLGGAAVLLAFIVVGALLGGDSRTAPVLVGAVLLGAVGTADDRWMLSSGLRMLIEAVVAVGVWATGLGWDLGLGAAVDLVATVVWLVVLINAFNIFDNMDGVAGSVAGVIAAGIVGVGLASGDTWLAVMAATLCGACLGFLPHNLARPARIFLGDGGSMPVGFVLATLTMEGVAGSGAAWQSLIMGVLLAGLPAVDMVMRILARRRIGQSIFLGGRDGLAHWTKRRVHTARAVVVALGGAQALISVLAVVAARGGSVAIVPAILFYLTTAGVMIAALDVRETAPDATVTTVIARSGPPPWTAALILPLAVLIGVSPYFGGWYDSSQWAPAGFAALIAATVGLIARPVRVGGPMLAALGGLGGLGLVALTSGLWADSVQQAVVSGNEYLAYAAVLALAIVLMRSRRDALTGVAALGVLPVTVGLVTVIQLLGGDPASMFVDGRLDQPLGYINGQAAFFLIGIWPCLALAEQRQPVRAAGGMVGVALLASLLLLSQSRGAALALLVTVVVVLALLPGRARRTWALITAFVAVAAAAPALLDVYSSSRNVPVSASTVHAAALSVIAAALGAGIAWGLVAAAVRRQPAERLRRVSTALLFALVLAAGGVALAKRGDLSRDLRTQYHAFVTVGIEPQGSDTPTSRLASGSGSRYDYWQIAWKVS